MLRKKLLFILIRLIYLLHILCPDVKVVGVKINAHEMSLLQLQSRLGDPAQVCQPIAWDLIFLGFLI